METTTTADASAAENDVTAKLRDKQGHINFFLTGTYHVVNTDLDNLVTIEHEDEEGIRNFIINYNGHRVLRFFMWPLPRPPTSQPQINNGKIERSS